MAHQGNPNGRITDEQQHHLLALQELRIECGNSSELWIQLDEGTAEIFGAELQRGFPVNAAGQKIAVFTWDGCKISIKGKKPDSIYKVSDTPMLAYRKTHEALNSKRQAALDSGSSGPHCIFLGPTDCGKSTLSKMFSNWAVRDGWEPTYVDLDIGQGSVTVPGCIAATPVEQPVIGEQGYLLEVPLVYFFGHASPADHPELYKLLVDRLASVLWSRAEVNPKAAAAGLIINTMGWIDGLGYELQVHAIASLKVNVVLVLEQDRLFNQISKQLKVHTGISVAKLIKSGGVVVREKNERKGARDRRIQEYFYGTTSCPLVPVTQTMRLDQLSVFRVGDGPRPAGRGNTMGARASADPFRPTKLTSSAEMVQSLMSISHAASEGEIASSASAGFILIKGVDAARGTASYLSPSPGNLPGKYLVTGSVKSDMK